MDASGSRNSHRRFWSQSGCVGCHAGYAGAALALEAWAWQLNNPGDKPMPGVASYPNQDLHLDDVKNKMLEGDSEAGRKPRVLTIGALRRCGTGAVDLCEQAGVPDENVLKWDLRETRAKPGPYEEITTSDIFITCMYLSDEIPPFLNDKSLSSPDRKFSVVCDVSYDTTNPPIAIPIYKENSTFGKPTLLLQVEGDPPLAVISIDDLASLLPREARDAFSQALLSSLLRFKECKRMGSGLEAVQQ